MARFRMSTPVTVVRSGLSILAKLTLQEEAAIKTASNNNALVETAYSRLASNSFQPSDPLIAECLEVFVDEELLTLERKEEVLQAIANGE